MRQRVGLAAAQVALIAALGSWWLTGESGATSTRIDWLFVTFTVLTPVTLAASFWAGRFLRPRPGHSDPPAARIVTRGAQAVTLALLIPTPAVCPFAAFGAIALGGIG